MFLRCRLQQTLSGACRQTEFIHSTFSKRHNACPSTATRRGRAGQQHHGWGIRRINEHYRKEWGEDFEARYPGRGITAEHIFAYTYALLHDPVYRHKYAIDLTRELPRLPLYHDFDIWAKMGQELLDLHIGFESAEPYPLQRIDKPGMQSA